MMQSISHWGQFEMQAAGTENFRDGIAPLRKDWEKELERSREAIRSMVAQSQELKLP